VSLPCVNAFKFLSGQRKTQSTEKASNNGSLCFAHTLFVVCHFPFCMVAYFFHQTHHKCIQNLIGFTHEFAQKKRVGQSQKFEIN